MCKWSGRTAASYPIIAVAFSMLFALTFDRLRGRCGSAVVICLRVSSESGTTGMLAAKKTKARAVAVPKGKSASASAKPLAAAKEPKAAAAAKKNRVAKRVP